MRSPAIFAPFALGKNFVDALNFVTATLLPRSSCRRRSLFTPTKCARQNGKITAACAELPLGRIQKILSTSKHYANFQAMFD